MSLLYSGLRGANASVCVSTLENVRLKGMNSGDDEPHPFQNEWIVSYPHGTET